MTDLVWCAGLFVGEGCTYLHRGRYLTIKISMHDMRAVMRFFQTTQPFLLPTRGTRPSNPRVIMEPYTYHGEPKTNYTVRYGGNPALGVARALFPYLEGTDKGDQMVRVAREAGVSLS